MDILAIGETLMEFSEASDPKIDDYYLPGYGGDTSNFAVAASRQGAKTGYFTALGQDTFGKKFLNLWKKEAIDTSLVLRKSDAHTGLYFISYGENGHEFTYHCAGSAASLLGPEDLKEEAVTSCKFMHLSGITQAISESSCDLSFQL